MSVIGLVQCQFWQELLCNDPEKSLFLIQSKWSEMKYGLFPLCWSPRLSTRFHFARCWPPDPWCRQGLGYAFLQWQEEIILKREITWGAFECVRKMCCQYICASVCTLKTQYAKMQQVLILCVCVVGGSRGMQSMQVSIHTLTGDSHGRPIVKPHTFPCNGNKWVQMGHFYSVVSLPLLKLMCSAPALNDGMIRQMAH